jgi:hypothetical protein
MKMTPKTIHRVGRLYTNPLNGFRSFVSAKTDQCYVIGPDDLDWVEYIGGRDRFLSQPCEIARISLTILA